MHALNMFRVLKVSGQDHMDSYSQPGCSMYVVWLNHVCCVNYPRMCLSFVVPCSFPLLPSYMPFWCPPLPFPPKNAQLEIVTWPGSSRLTWPDTEVLLDVNPILVGLSPEQTLKPWQFSDFQSFVCLCGDWAGSGGGNETGRRVTEVGQTPS